MAPLNGRIIIGLNPPYEWLLALLHPVFWERRWNCLLQYLTFPLRNLQQPKRVVLCYSPDAMLMDCVPFLSLSTLVAVAVAVPPAGVTFGALSNVP